MPFKKGQTIKKHENDYPSCVSIKFSDEILFRCLTENYSRSVPKMINLLGRYLQSASDLASCCFNLLISSLSDVM